MRVCSRNRLFLCIANVVQCCRIVSLIQFDLHLISRSNGYPLVMYMGGPWEASFPGRASPGIVLDLRPLTAPRPPHEVWLR